MAVREGWEIVHRSTIWVDATVAQHVIWGVAYYPASDTIRAYASCTRLGTETERKTVPGHVMRNPISGRWEVTFPEVGGQFPPAGVWDGWNRLIHDQMERGG